MQKPSKFLGLLVILAGAVLLCRCDIQTAGSSVGTGNPTEIQVCFTGGDGTPRALTGKVDVYAATQIPVPGFQPQPLASFPADSANSVAIKADALKTIADSLWPSSSHDGDSVFRFNVVVTGDSQGSVLQGLRYRHKDGEFSRLDSLVMKAGSADNVAEVSPKLVGVVDYSFYIDPKDFLPLKDHYVFVPGTGFIAKSDSGHFTLKSLPQGRYAPSFISLWQPGHGQAQPQDSVQIYGLTSQLSTDNSDTLAVGGYQSTVPLPAQYKH